jgi:hypothetical protein
MKKLILLFIGCFVYIFCFPQNVEITLYQNSIKMCNDTLYCKYRIENKTDSVLVLYSIESLSVKNNDEYLNSKVFYEGSWPRLWATIIDSNNEYAGSGIRFKMPPSRFPPDTTPPPHRPSPPKKYLVLQPFQSVEHENFLILHSMKLVDDSLFFSQMEVDIPYNFVTDGIQKIQLEYFSGPAFRKRFNKDKQRDSNLKNSVMFEGIIKSNVCTFTYPADYVQPESDQTDEAALKEADNDKSTVDFPYFKWVKNLCYVVVIVLSVTLLGWLIRRKL